SNTRTDQLIAGERTTRDAANKKLQGNIDATNRNLASGLSVERNERTQAITDSNTRTDQLIAGERTTRDAANKKLQGNIDATNRNLASGLSVERNERTQAITDSNTRTDQLIAGEQAARMVLDGQLNNRINIERNERISGDQKTLASANNYTDWRFNELRSYGDQKINYLNNKIERIEKQSNAGIASVAAMSNIPYVNNSIFSFGVGLGQYKNGSAVALGMQRKLSDSVNIRASTSWNNSDSAVFGAGISIGW
ncbi:YadA C-terminal domain-containing protein, partial [Xenorhabdus entomophaga]|uniref:YadA C-terminal domain-containing protein n=1 Tax=Xenorhabdus entomophaga TaxID=3136257 RepID=UPI0030F459DF